MEVEQYLDFSNIFKHLKKSEEIHIPKKRVGLEIQQTTRFYLPPQNKTLRAQYCHIYCVRFQNLSNRIKYNKNDPQYVELIQKIQTQPGTIKATGTLFKEMKLKPYYFQSATQIKLANYVSDDDSCYLEDRSGRVKLIIKDCILHLANEQRKISTEDLVTGLVVMIEGSIVANNVVKVEKMYLPQFLEAPMYRKLEQKSYACIISGINYNYQENTSKLRHLIQYLQGNLYDGSGNEVAENLSQIIIAGNLYASPEESSDCLTGTMKMQQDFKQLYSKLQHNIKGVDELINQLVSITPVAVMPGVNEPLSQMLPQGPLHKAHFGECFDQGNKLVFLTNPAEFELGQIKVLGTSGQNIDDMKRYSTIREKTDLDLIELTLFYGHIAPTLPDTLIAYPQVAEDPFVLDQFPNIYFAGNMTSFGTKKISDNLTIISVPTFSETGTVCVINLNTLECFPVTVQ